VGAEGRGGIDDALFLGMDAFSFPALLAPAVGAIAILCLLAATLQAVFALRPMGAGGSIGAGVADSEEACDGPEMEGNERGNLEFVEETDADAKLRGTGRMAPGEYERVAPAVSRWWGINE
jgi:hypothetical protein